MVLPLAVAAGLYILWILFSIVGSTAAGKHTRVVSIIFSVAQLAVSVWASVATFEHANDALADFSERISISHTWFLISQAGDFAQFQIDFSPAAVILWVLLSVVLFSLLLLEKNRISAQALATYPLMGLSVLIMLGSANFLTYLAGSLVAAVGGYLCTSFGGKLTAKNAFQYISSVFLSEAFLILGVLCLFYTTGYFAFDKIRIENDLVNSDVGQLGLGLVILGILLRNFQFPFLRTHRILALSGSSSAVTILVGHMVASVALVGKIYLPLFSVPENSFFVLIPLATCMLVSLFFLFESSRDDRTPLDFLAAMSSYTLASAFVSLATGSYASFLAQVFFGTLTAMTCYFVFIHKDSIPRFFIWLSLVLALPLPFTGLGWGRFLQYEAFLDVTTVDDVLLTTVFILKIVADLVFILGIVGWFQKVLAGPSTKEPQNWLVIAGVSVLSLSVFSFIGDLPIDEFFLKQWAWFDRTMIPKAIVKSPSSIVEALNISAGLFSVLANIFVATIAVAMGFFWLFREPGVAPKRFSNATMIRLSGWEFGEKFFRPFHFKTSRAMRFFDEEILDYFFSVLWVRPLLFIQRQFDAFDTQVLDRRIIDGFSAAVVTIGKSLKILHNGQVQFHFATGLVLLAAILTKFIFFKE